MLRARFYHSRHPQTHSESGSRVGDEQMLESADLDLANNPPEAEVTDEGGNAYRYGPLFMYRTAYSDKPRGV